MDANTAKNGSTKPVDQLREIVAKAEALLATLADDGDAAVVDLRHRVKHTISNAKDKLSSLQSQAQDAATNSIKSTDAYVQDNPWIAVGLAAAVGAIVGALVSRRI
jgi:ElaB/YqjD/DUF883 family membrane-anchored ribosome-binding protein